MMLRRMTTRDAVVSAGISNRAIAGAMANIGEGVAIAIPAVEQIGQTCESMVLELNSTQQCICDTRKTMESNTATRQIRLFCNGIDFVNAGQIPRWSHHTLGYRFSIRRNQSGAEEHVF